MKSFIGKVCPYCKTAFTEADEIVVCSSCEMPHHKECWIENQGCTTFGCLGTINMIDGALSSVTATELSYDEAVVAANRVFCTNCGARNNTEASFCVQCGHMLRRITTAPVYEQANPTAINPYAYTQPTPPAYTAPPAYNPYPTYASSYSSGYGVRSDVIDEDVVRLVGSRQEYYVPKFRELKTKSSKVSWNWIAFLFTPHWLMFRRMYGYGMAAFGVMFLVAIIGNPLLTMLAIGGDVLFGLFGNFIYMKRVEKVAAMSKGMEMSYKTQFINNNAGGRTAALVWSIIGWALFISILSIV